MFARAFFAALAVFISAVLAGTAAASTQTSASRSKRADAAEAFSAEVRKLVARPPFDCSGPVYDSKAALRLEDRIFDLLSRAALDALNNEPSAAHQLESTTLKLEKYKALSDRITNSWRRDELLRFKVLVFRPLIVIQLGIWNQDSFAVYAPKAWPDSLAIHWMMLRRQFSGDHAPFDQIQISPLWRGPSGTPRFLVVKHFSGCMAGMTLDYIVRAYDWHAGSHSLETIFSTQSSFSENDPKWKFETSGKQIAIPYCWFGPFELGSVSAPICSVDTYDLSGDAVRFLRTQDDPQDLALVAHIMTAANAHDLRALRALCMSDHIARQIMEHPPGTPYFVGLQRKHLGQNEEQLDFEDDLNIKFTLTKRSGEWMVSEYRLTRNY